MEYIPLQHAHVGQNTSSQGSTDWQIKENVTEELLGTLPSRLTDAEVFGILGTMRKYELEAFNKGIKFGKIKQNEVSAPQITQLNERVRIASIENERIAEALDREQKR